MEAVKPNLATTKLNPFGHTLTSRGILFARLTLRLLRVRQWIKNLLVFAPLVFSEQLSQRNVLTVLVVFGLMCLLSSSVYIINDIIDAPRDRLHPQKKLRPIASGMMQPVTAGILATTLLITAGVISSMLPVPVIALMGVYVGLNAAYSLYLKHLVIIDVMIIALGFVLRVIVGGLAVNVQSSHWIILCTFFVSLFLCFGKRKNETQVLQHNSRSHRHILEHYTPDFLNQLLSLTAAMTIISYAMYTIDTAATAHFETEHLIYTLPFVIYGIFRYLHIVYNMSAGGDPTRIFVTDIPIMTTSVLWLISFILITQVL